MKKAQMAKIIAEAWFPKNYSKIAKENFAKEQESLKKSELEHSYELALNVLEKRG